MVRNRLPVSNAVYLEPHSWTRDDMEQAMDEAFAAISPGLQCHLTAPVDPDDYGLLRGAAMLVSSFEAPLPARRIVLRTAGGEVIITISATP